MKRNTSAETAELRAGQRVDVKWDKAGWLPGVFVEYCPGEYGEDFQRCVVKMDNGFACHPPGYHPACVRPSVI